MERLSDIPEYMQAIVLRLDTEISQREEAIFLDFYFMYEGYWPEVTDSHPLKFFAQSDERIDDHDGPRIATNGTLKFRYQGWQEIGAVSHAFTHWRHRRDFQLKSITVDDPNRNATDMAEAYHYVVAKFLYRDRDHNRRSVMAFVREFCQQWQDSLTDEYDGMLPIIFYEGKPLLAISRPPSRLRSILCRLTARFRTRC